MIYKEYGKTGKKVSAVGFGGMRFDTSKNNIENAELLQYANSKGINYFDTAPYYCNDQSEDIFGMAFKNMPNDFYVSTKGSPNEFDTSKKAKQAVKKSLDRLGISKIHFYHIWCLLKMEDYELAMRPGGQYEGLLQCKEEGLIDHIVFSSHQPGNEIENILEEGKLEGVLLGVNILNFPYRWNSVLTAFKHGFGVAAMNPLFGGAIPTHENKLSFLASHGETPTEAALRFLISCPQISVVLNGFTIREHIDMACRVSDNASPFLAAELNNIKTNISKNMNSACTGCGYCGHCPQGIPVPSYMQLYNEKHLFGSTLEEMKHKTYLTGLTKSQSGVAGNCIECGLCEKACTQHLNIIKRLKEMSNWEI